MYIQYVFNAGLQFDCCAKWTLQGERASESEAKSRPFPFFPPFEKQSAQMGRNLTWRQVMGEATKGSGRKGSWRVRAKADHVQI